MLSCLTVSPSDHEIMYCLLSYTCPKIHPEMVYLSYQFAGRLAVGYRTAVPPSKT